MELIEKLAEDSQADPLLLPGFDYDSRLRSSHFLPVGRRSDDRITFWRHFSL